MALKFEEVILHDKQGDFLKVKHLRLFGTNEEIGHKLGEIARNQHQIQRPRFLNAHKHSCQHNYLEKNYPIHLNRMRGFANAYDDDIYKTEYDYTCFGNPLNFLACSAVFYPPIYTETQTGIISRNLDLPTISFSEIIAGKQFANEKPAMSNPYIIEIYPDEGYSSLITLSFELYGLALDGINSEGLSVVHLHADNIRAEAYRPSMEFGVGINEMLVVQLLLDNCKTVDEAKEFLWCNKHYYMLLPTHFLIADRHGKSFVWEYPLEHNKEFVIEGNSEIQIITNFPLHKYPNPNTFPTSKDKSCPFDRFMTLYNAIKNEKGKISVNKMKEINSKVFITDDMFAEKPSFPDRTIYHNLYDTNKKTMEISFYRMEHNDLQLRTDYYKFELK